MSTRHKEMAVLSQFYQGCTKKRACFQVKPGFAFLVKPLSQHVFLLLFVREINKGNMDFHKRLNMLHIALHSGSQRLVTVNNKLDCLPKCHKMNLPMKLNTGINMIGHSTVWRN